MTANLVDSEIPFDAEGFERALTLIKSLDNRNRLLILCILCYREANVSDMASASGLSMSAVSQHLTVLKNAALVTSRKESQTVIYSLASDEVRQMIGLLKDLYCAA
ncbi:ArsR/SmtB family transcription factor [Kordiimonas lipolytica]|uniref:ArsR/SmtB family transcription factor n=1 Tax=Kordiimonas lipolytica TaxID=1662421 RepID=A0ABV8UCA9_9PROT|nr:metalloregulator ArsR/SmtB family transcription factor [Kordiimonas lipolytica]